jgi:diguanylate cyclase (GGDEF)-like protein
MAIAVLPLATSAVFGYLKLHKGVLGEFQDVAMRQRQELDPTQHLRLLLVEATDPVDAFIDDGDAREPGAYRELRSQIESLFVALGSRLRDTTALATQIGRARDDWTSADRLAGEALAVRRPPGDAQTIVVMGQFHGLIDDAVDKLGVIHDDLDRDIGSDHDIAIRDAARAEQIAAAAAVCSVLAILLGLFIVGRVIAGSVERLVTGAELFASGDRAHRIDIQLPPELHRVAQEFNRMIGRIHDSERVLVELAHRDSLTLLPNRRAFDEALDGMLARHERLGEEWALLTLDLDHFKRINDTYGHGVGDDVLRAVAQSLVEELRPFDQAFRIGGEEFAVVFGGTSSEKARVVADRLRKSIENLRIHAGTVTVEVTVSAGLAPVGKGSTKVSMTTEADAALYRAKEGGRNRVVMAGDAPAN